jgi:hypothetical protein
METTEKVVRFFQNIFRLQTEFAENQEAEGECQLLSEDSGGERVYELRARCAEQTKTRRMSIRQLGESVESKSTCFKVIYDELLVVKIPPRAFPDFETYLKHIQTEKTIAAQLAPHISCLYPGIAGVLKKIPQLDPTGRRMLETEADFIRLLTKQPGLQSHLKIDGRFAFFMDLSKYLFLNQILIAMHEKGARTPEAILKNREALFSLDAFETIYGSGHEAIFFAVNQLFRRCQQRLDQVIEQTEGLLSIPDYLREEWFLERLAGRLPDIMASGYSAGAAANIKRALAGLTEADKETIRSYKGLVRAHVGRKIFHSNQSKMAALITNALELISRLKEQAVAVRDLKPDNIFVAGTFDGADHLLGDPATYDLGLIDLETALSLKAGRPESLEQPLMAGTPSFMTPSQVFSNSVLIGLFGADTPRVLYMQDWFAAVGIIYNIVTGEHLFYRTAKLIPEIVRIKHKSPHRPPEIFKQVSWNFWYTASAELAEKKEAFRSRLDALQVELTARSRDALASEAQMERRRLKDCMHQMIERQEFFPGSRKALADAQAEAVRKNRIKREKRQNSTDADLQKQNREIAFLRSLEILKAQIPITGAIEELPDKPLPAARLMNLLFYRAFFAMYDPGWSERPMPAGEALLLPDYA